MTAERRVLVVNADDFGLTPGVCDGILTAHRHGILTSTSVLTPAPAFARHAAALRDSGLAAGLHLCAVGEDPPLLGPAEIPTLVDRHGRFPMSWRHFLVRAAGGRIDADDLRREFEAQHEALRTEGITPTHVDSHQNLHLWPAVGSVAVDLAVRHRIPVLRVTGTDRRGPLSLGVRLLGRRLVRRARRRDLLVPDVATGLDNAGGVDENRLRDMISWVGRADGHGDITVHPGSEHDPDRERYRWGYTWPEELRALCAPGMREHVSHSGLELGSFVDLVLASLGRRGRPDRGG